MNQLPVPSKKLIQSSAKNTKNIIERIYWKLMATKDLSLINKNANLSNFYFNNKEVYLMKGYSALWSRHGQDCYGHRIANTEF
jgi:hypothetical protein